MRRLGYERYGAVGNDAGSMISPEIGRLDPDHVVGVHVTQIFSFPSGDPAEMADLTEEEQTRAGHAPVVLREQVVVQHSSWRSSRRRWRYALADSPLGLLAWKAQLLGEDLDPDFALANVTLYWLTGTAASAARLYYENAHARHHPTEPTTVPLGAGRRSAATSAASAGSPSATTATSSAGRCTTTAATSRPTRRPTCWSATSASSTRAFAS